jgi:AraC-like DNA-binding protein
MMTRDGLNVKETAFRLGYSSEFQFSRAFKRLEGVSPMRHIRALTEKPSIGANGRLKRGPATNPLPADSAKTLPGARTAPAGQPEASGEF